MGKISVLASNTYVHNFREMLRNHATWRALGNLFNQLKTLGNTAPPKYLLNVGQWFLNPEVWGPYPPPGTWVLLFEKSIRTTTCLDSLNPHTKILDSFLVL